MHKSPAQFEPQNLPAVSAAVASSWQDVRLANEQPHNVMVLLVEENHVTTTNNCKQFLWRPDAAAAESHSWLSAQTTTSKAQIDAAIQLSNFKAKQGEALPPLVVLDSAGKPCTLLLLGLGGYKPLPQWGPNAYHAAGAALAAACKSHKLEKVHVAMHSLPSIADTTAAVTSFVSAAVNGLYEGTVRYRSKPEQKVCLQSMKLTVVGNSSSSSSTPADAVSAAADRGLTLARGTLTTRFLVEAPANVCTPSHLAAAAQHIADLDPTHYSLTVLEEAECRALGMGLFVGVAQGSDEPLKFIHLTYKPKGEVRHKIALVGKGLTFDSGGYNLKVQGGIETMKCDMGGAGAVLGAARALLDLQPKGLEVHFITAACENMVSGRATRPSDIHTSAAGITVEVNDTDAEGRLTLADALWYAQDKAAAETVVDIATLTGAAGIALGQDTGALFSNCDDLAEALDSAGRQAGEKLWRMPLTESLRKKIESPIADIKNYAGRWGGAITAALFLKEFVKEGVKWGHMDVAGPAWDDAACLPTGFGAALLTEWVMAQQVL